MIAKARAGDGEAFAALTEPYRRELRVHCYRMLGNLDDAEDALQETLVSAWRGLETFEERASLRSWLYQIATRRCLNALRSTRRRAAKEWDVPGVDAPEPTRLNDLIWLEPFPDALLPEAQYETSEAISLAYVTALQVLPARQRAALILRDVLGYHADQVARMLDVSLDSANSLLKRARAAIARHRELATDRQPPPAPNSPAERAIVERFVRAFKVGDLDGLIALLTEDARLAMPPIPLEYQGRDVLRRFYAVLMDAGRRYDLVPTRANGQLAFGTYVRTKAGGAARGNGLVVITLSGERICDIVRFESEMLDWFGLPRSIP